MQPLGDRILFDPIEIEQKSKGGIVIATVKSEDYEPPKIGRCVSMGPGTWDLSGLQWLDPSTKVTVGKAYQLIKSGDFNYTLHGKRYMLARMADVVMEITEEELHGA